MSSTIHMSTTLEARKGVRVIAGSPSSLGLHIAVDHTAPPGSVSIFINWQDVPEFIRQSQARYDEYLLQKEHDDGPRYPAGSASGSGASTDTPGPPADSASSGTSPGG